MSKKKADAAENVKVLVRCRPLNAKEKEKGHTSGVELDIAQHTVTVNSLVGNPDRFTFDAVINNTFSQKDIFTQFILPLVDSVLDGFNATVFAYGQSGSGKTHTMTGVMGDEEMEGVIPRCFKYIFEQVKEKKELEPGKQYSMYVSFVELYNGKVRDLLATKQVTLDVRESKDKTFFVQGVNIPQVKFPEEIIRLMEEGTDRRRVASTELNADSSRSHSLFTLILECSETLEDGTVRSVTSKLNLVDLAGSERQGKTGASGDTLKEGCNINLSLSALGTVIDCIVKGAPHVPFRSSPLTMLLKDSLGGNSKTVMFANINPSANNVSETVSTLRFADRAKQIKNKPVVNMDTKDQKIAELTEMVNELKTKLEKYSTGGTQSLEEEVEQLREKVGELEVNLDNAIKSREADLVDFESSKQKIIEERQSFNSKLVELEEKLSQEHNNLQIAETNARDAKSSLDEILQLCSKYLNNGSVIVTADELETILKDQSFGGNSAESNQLKTQLETLTAENKSLKKDYKSLKRDLEQQLKNAKEEAQAAETKMKRMKKELQASHDAWEVAEEDSTDGGETKDKKEKKPNPQKAIKALTEDFSRRQEELVAAMKLDDNGAAAIKALQKENEELRQQLLKSSAGPAAGDSSASNAAELEEIRKSLLEVQKERDNLYTELNTAREEASAATKNAAEMSGKVNEVRAEYERKLASAASSAGELDKLQTKLKERNEQLEQMRTLLEKQKALIVKSNEKAEYFQQQVKEANQKTIDTEQKFRDMLDEKDAQFQKAVSERLEEYMIQRKEEEKERNTHVKKLKKKITKMQDTIAEMEENFDKKVLECEELRELLSEQKLQQMKLVKRIDSTVHGGSNNAVNEEIEVEEKKEKIQNALERAKEERKRKSDMFAMGEVQNAKNM